MSTELPTVARLYYSGTSGRRYKRASTQPGPGEPLCFKSTAEQHVRWAVQRERQRIVSALMDRADEAHKRQDYAEEQRLRDAASLVHGLPA